MRRDRGSVLLVSLWALGFFTSMTVAQATRVGLQVRWVGRQREQLRADALLQSALAYAMWQLQIDAREIDTSTEAWADSKEWAPMFLPEQDSWTVKISDAQGTISINDASLETLMRIPQLVPTAQAIVDARADHLFAHPEELITRIGLSQEAYLAVRPLLRMQGDKAVNLHSATAQTLEILGLSKDLAQQIFDLTHHKTSPVVFSSEEAKDEQVVKDRLGLTLEEASQVANLAKEGWLDVKSSCFEVQADAVAQPRQIQRSVRALLLRSNSGTPIQVIEWSPS